jgi:hypothetical protein
LKDQLSKVIHQKYPNSHIDVSSYAISACNAAFNEDSPKIQQPCLDYRVKPRPDSEEFKFKIALDSDATHYRPIKNFDEVSDNSLTTFEKRYNIGRLPNQKVLDQPKIDYVPLAGPFEWPYQAWSKLMQAGVTEYQMFRGSPSVIPATRYEFAVGVARLLDQKEKRAKDSPKVKALIANLTFEFEPEMTKLGLHIDHDQILRNLAKQDIVWQPRYKYLQLTLSYGKKFDRKLRQKIEHVIEEYTDAWLKSNSSANADSKK